jgi:hypothetical protein
MYDIIEKLDDLPPEIVIPVAALVATIGVVVAIIAAIVVTIYEGVSNLVRRIVNA